MDIEAKNSISNRVGHFSDKGAYLTSDIDINLQINKEIQKLDFVKEINQLRKPSQKPALGIKSVSLQQPNKQENHMIFDKDLPSN